MIGPSPSEGRASKLHSAAALSMLAELEKLLGVKGIKAVTAQIFYLVRWREMNEAYLRERGFVK